MTRLDREVLRLLLDGEERDASQIGAKVAEETKAFVTPAATYAALGRLATIKFVTSRPEHEKRAGARRLFKITDVGRTAVEHGDVNG